ncbi:hypothetical protein MRX96_009969 [Rhipicephalus microplus]
MEVTVNGRDADQEELESSDWVTKVSKRVAELQQSQQRERDGATRAASTSSGCGKEGRTMPAGFNGDKHGVSGRPSYKAAGKKLAERSVASHLPRLPNADHKVIIRPKVGLTLTRHSAPVIGGAIVRGANPSIEVDREGARNSSPDYHRRRSRDFLTRHPMMVVIVPRRTQNPQDHRHFGYGDCADVRPPDTRLSTWGVESRLPGWVSERDLREAGCSKGTHQTKQRPVIRFCPGSRPSKTARLQRKATAVTATAELMPHRRHSYEDNFVNRQSQYLARLNLTEERDEVVVSPHRRRRRRRREGGERHG